MMLQGRGLLGNYKLMADIDLGGMEWMPISVLLGSFDGGDHVISNFKITGDVKYVGLFGCSKGEIQNLGLENFTIDVIKNTFGNVYAGGLVGSNDGTITNCYVTGDVSVSAEDVSAGGLVGENSGTIANSYAMGDVSVSITTAYSESYTGGLVGANIRGTIENCYATGDVSGTSPDESAIAGGLVGVNSGTIKSSYAMGDIDSSCCAGGLVGVNDDGTITNCYAMGDISSTSTNSFVCVGGLVGMHYGTITNSYATGDVSASADDVYVGGLVGVNLGTITNCYRYSGQNFKVTMNGITTSSATNTEGIAKDMSTLQSVNFQKNTLAWSADDWNFTEGAHPTLK